MLADELDIKRAHVGVQAGILNREDKGILIRSVVMGVPPARWGDKDGIGRPHRFYRVNDVTILIHLFADQGVGVRPGKDRQIQRDRLMTMRFLYFPGRQEIEQ